MSLQDYSPFNSDIPVAIVGMACRLPGADDYGAFWKNISTGVSSVQKVSGERFDRELFYDPRKGIVNKSYSDLGALIKYRPIDRSICPMTDELEATHDIVHRNLCEVASRACIDAGLDPFRFPVKNTGVYIGNTRAGNVGSNQVVSMTLPETIRYLMETETLRRGNGGVTLPSCERIMAEVVREVRERHASQSNSAGGVAPANGAANIISIAHKLDGPCMVFNSACASSLQALSQAVLGLQLGHIDMAFAGGASFFHTDTLVLFSYAHSLATSRSCPFDAEADGLVVGEGAIVLLLKRLDDALACGDTVHAVIRGIGVASDGKGKSLWAPRKEGQIEAMRRAYRADVNPSDIGFIEAHATSTALGDATEMEAINDYFGEYVRGRSVPLGSTKGNVGHTIEVAGLTSLLKAVLCMKNRTIPPVAGLKTLSGKIPWDDIPFHVPTAPVEWRQLSDKPRLAAVNSFGIGGLNVHVVLEEFPEKAAVSKTSTPRTGNKRRITVKNESSPIAIIGFGNIFPGALNSASYQELLEKDATRFTHVPAGKFNENILRDFFFPNRNDIPPFLGGFIENYQYDWRKNRIPPKQIENASPLQFMILDAVNESFDVAGLAPGDIDRKRVGVVVGTSFGSDFSVQLGVTLFLPRLQKILEQKFAEAGMNERTIRQILQEYADILLKRMPALIDETGSFTVSALASRITKTFDLMGGAVAIDAENASSFASIQCCVDQLRSKMNDMMICISGQQDMGAGVFESMVKHEAYSGAPFNGWFDQKGRGYPPAEGCGVLLLKRHEDALKDHNKIFGLIRSVGASSGIDRYRTHKKSLTRAIENSEHGTSKHPVLPDFVELATQTCLEENVHFVDALADFLHEIDPVCSKNDIQLVSPASRIGNMGNASGMAAIIKTLLAFSADRYPSESEVQKTATYISRYKDRFGVPKQPVPWSADHECHVYLNAGSYNSYSIIVSQPDRTRTY